MTDRPKLALEPYTIKHVDDGKQKWQSHEQHFDADIGQAQMGADAYIQLSIVSYGKSKAESEKELMDALKHLRAVVAAAITELEASNGLIDR